MFNSKFFFVMMFLTLLAVGAAVFFQYQEMEQYDLIETIKERFFAASPAVVDSTEAKPAADSTEAKPAADSTGAKPTDKAAAKPAKKTKNEKKTAKAPKK